MTNEDDALRDAIIDQLNAELGAAGMTMKQMAQRLGRPYDSTRNYLKKEREIPLGIFVEMCAVLNVAPDELVTRARMRLPR